MSAGRKAPTGEVIIPGVEPGSIFLGKYRIERVIGKGGMGVVALATHLQLDEQVAIKLLRTDVATDKEAGHRFLREAQATVKLKSEHVARVIDVGTTETGSPYIVMEFLEGQDLDQMIEANGTIAPVLAVDFLLQACEALAEAHSLGIVHRDLKPSNFFVTWRSDGTPLLKVLDFGISKAPVMVELSLTKTASVLGTPAYMSPEQMRSARTVDPRSDLWSLGTVAYEMVTGRQPFEAESFSEMCVKVAVDPPDPIDVDLPDGLAAMILRCLEKEPERRFQTVGELAMALLPLARDQRQASLSVDRIARTLGRAATSSGAHLAPAPRRGGGRANTPVAVPVTDAPSAPVAAAPVAATPVAALPLSAPPPTLNEAAPLTPPPGGLIHPPRRTTPWGVADPPDTQRDPMASPQAMMVAPPAAVASPWPSEGSQPSWPGATGSYPGEGSQPSWPGPGGEASAGGVAPSDSQPSWPTTPNAAAVRAPREDDEHDAPSRRSHRGLVIGGVAAVVIAIGIVIVVVGGGGGDEQPAPAAGTIVEDAGAAAVALPADAAAVPSASPDSAVAAPVAVDAAAVERVETVETAEPTADAGSSRGSRGSRGSRTSRSGSGSGSGSTKTTPDKTDKTDTTDKLDKTDKTDTLDIRNSDIFGKRK